MRISVCRYISYYFTRFILYTMKKIQIETKYKDLMERWIKDLRDNPELQSKDALLNSEGKYCCLGRLCLIAGMEEDTIRHEGVIDKDLLGYELDIIPPSFIGEALVDSIVFLLTSMNDGLTKHSSEKLEEWNLTKDSYTFPEIADFLEERIEYYDED